MSAAGERPGTIAGTLRRLLTASPRIKRLGRRALAGLIRLAARPDPAAAFARPAHLDLDLLAARTDELNRAAEHYFARLEHPEFVVGKPFTEPDELPRRLFDLGVLFHALRLSPHDVVLELGAGTCWVSHFLNRYGCKTISVDVSATALRLGRELFERDPATRWEAEPEFLVYDGHRIPLPDGSCDRIVLVDAFHHLPNPQEILRELARLLPEGGIVAMAEPGEGHSGAEAALREVEETGVLENEIILSEVEAMARRAGFTEAALLPYSLTATREIPIAGLGGIAESEALLDLWLAVHRGPYYLVLHKGPWVRTTRVPGRLDAGIELVAPSGVLHAAAGEGLALRFRVINRGDTRWLGTAAERPGWTRLGAHLYREAGTPPGELLDFDWLRIALPADLDPGAAAEVEAVLPPLGEPGAYRLVFDLVIEGLTWFAARGSAPLEARLLVEAAGSGSPGAARGD